MIHVQEMKASADVVQARVETLLADWTQENKSARLWQGDASLWTGTDEGQWLGWLRIVPEMQQQVDALVRFADGVCKDGFRDVLLLGMGGSSLCPEVLAMTFGSAPGYPRLHVLDSTAPEQVLCTVRAMPGGRPLVVHVLNRNYDAETKSMIPRNDCTITLRGLDVGDVQEAKLLAYDSVPVTVPISRDNDTISVTLPELRLWHLIVIE